MYRYAAVGIPLLVVQASDDPIAVADAVPRAGAQGLGSARLRLSNSL